VLLLCALSQNLSKSSTSILLRLTVRKRSAPAIYCGISIDTGTGACAMLQQLIPATCTICGVPANSKQHGLPRVRMSCCAGRHIGSTPEVVTINQRCKLHNLCLQTTHHVVQETCPLLGCCATHVGKLVGWWLPRESSEFNMFYSIQYFYCVSAP
jgi:hypothetical protein